MNVFVWASQVAGLWLSAVADSDAADSGGAMAAAADAAGIPPRVAAWLDAVGLAGFRFDDPLWLIALLAIPLLAWIESRRAKARTLLFVSTSAFASLPRSAASRFLPWLAWIRHLAIAALVIALARPQLGRSEFRVRTEGIAIQLSIDRSGSMDALDFRDDAGTPVNRLTAVKKVVRQFVGGDGGELSGRRDDAIGLVVFGGYAEQRCPMTLDHGALLDVLDQVKIPGQDLDVTQQRAARDLIREESGTAIGDGLVRAIAGLRDAKQKSRIVILLSDGENNSGIVDPPTAASVAKEQGIKVYTIGIGSTGIAPFRVRDDFGQERLIPTNVTLDEAVLRSIAETTGGQYFNAKTTAALAQVYAAIGELEKSEIESLLYSEYDDLFEGPLTAAIVLVLLEVILAATRFRRLP